MMKNTFLICLWAVLLCGFGCKPASGVGQNDRNSGEKKGSANGIGEVDRNYEPNRDLTPYVGEKRFAAQWGKENDEQVLIISGRTTEKGENGRAEIFATQYAKDRGAWVQKWKINDFEDGMGCDLAIHLPEASIKILDVDGDGLAEVSFIYELDNRCDASTVRAKLLLHHQDKKYAIRGYGQQFLGPPEHVMNQYLAEQGADPVSYKALDPAFDEAPQSIREFASHEWDAFIESENEAQK